MKLYVSMALIITFTNNVNGNLSDLCIRQEDNKCDVCAGSYLVFKHYTCKIPKKKIAKCYEYKSEKKCMVCAFKYRLS